MKTFTYAFDANVWICVFLSCLLLILINSIKRNFTSLTNLQIFEILMGVSTHSLPQTNCRRMKFLTWIWSAFILRSVYQSLIFCLYSRQFYEVLPTSLGDLVAGGYKIVCVYKSSHFIKGIPLLLKENLNITILRDDNEIKSLHYLEQHDERLYAAVTAKEIVYYYTSKEEHRKKLSVLPFNINIQQTTIYLPKHSFLVNEFNDIILRIYAAGLFKIWRSLSVDLRFSRQRSKAKHFNLSLENMKQICSVTCGLFSIALIIFALELASLRYTRLRQLFE